MIQKIESGFKILELRREEVFALLNNFTEERLNATNAEGKWTPAQVAAHLVLGEELTVAYLKIKLAKRDNLKNAGIREWFRSGLLNLALKSPFKFKAPEITTRIPQRITRDELVKRWLSTRTELRVLLDNFPPELRNKTIFKHPVAGPINIFQTLSFMEKHISHHLPQIRTRLKP